MTWPWEKSPQVGPRSVTSGGVTCSLNVCVCGVVLILWGRLDGPDPDAAGVCGVPSPAAPLRTHNLLLQAVPGAERARGAQGGSRPAARRAASPPPAPLGRGRGSWRQGGLCLPDSPVETAGVWGGWAGSAVGRRLFFPTAAPPPSHHPPLSSRPWRAVGLEEGAPESFKVTALSLPVGLRLPREFQTPRQEFSPGVGGGVNRSRRV